MCRGLITSIDITVEHTVATLSLWALILINQFGGRIRKRDGQLLFGVGVSSLQKQSDTADRMSTSRNFI